jgi:hypothetical protein
LARDLLNFSREIQIQDGDRDVTSVSYTAPPPTTAGPGKTGSQNKNPNEVTTGAYGNAFELALNTATNADGTTTDTLTYQNYQGQTNGSFSATSETGSGANLDSSYQALLSAVQGDGAMSGANASQLKDAFNQLEAKSQNGSTDATVSGGEMLVQAGGPIAFNGISAYQNGFVDSMINELTSQLNHDSTA